HYLASLDGERTGTVAVIVAAWTPSRECVADVLRNHRRLFTNRCHGLRVGGVGTVAQPPDVLIPDVTQCGWINCHPAIVVSQHAVADKVRCALRRADVNHVEGLFDDFTVPILQRAIKPRFPRISIDPYQP